jgi:hypothetical protein
MIVPKNEDVFSLEAKLNTLKETLLKERTEFGASIYVFVPLGLLKLHVIN